ncbi:hypothetical protein CPB83DRAFT_133372 [Crepidotus variabilis]|uniref:Uncharacterized protein n=1 Tax=Crepidotus variabilis TaxID=179855 RepID=A0A9P6E480_9AGAR|nr:hypothetical protein CPB83DRAFT_133372 [Crepidotus variabilis]
MMVARLVAVLAFFDFFRQLVNLSIFTICFTFSFAAIFTSELWRRAKRSLGRYTGHIKINTERLYYSSTPNLRYLTLHSVTEG